MLDRVRSDAYKRPESGLRLTRTRPMEGTCSGGTSSQRSSRGRDGPGRRRCDRPGRGRGAERAAHRSRSGVVYSRTGLLAAYGAQFVQGLRYGIAYATKGTGAVNGRKIELTLVDDGTDPVKAVAGAKDLIGKGYKIITGTASSGIARAARAARRPEQDPLHLRPGGDRRGHRASTRTRSARAARSIQDVLAASSYLGGGGGQDRHRVRPGLRLRARATSSPSSS